MKIEGQFLFENLTADAVWGSLTNPNRIASCLPGCEELTPTGDNSYEMSISIGIGAIRGKFTGSIRLHDVHPTSSYAMTVSGKGAQSFINGEGTVHVTPDATVTVVRYSGDVNAGGAIASVGQRMISGAARMIIDRFFKCIAENLTPGLL